MEHKRIIFRRTETLRRFLIVKHIFVNMKTGKRRDIDELRWYEVMFCCCKCRGECKACGKYSVYMSPSNTSRTLEHLWDVFDRQLQVQRLFIQRAEKMGLSVYQCFTSGTLKKQGMYSEKAKVSHPNPLYTFLSAQVGCTCLWVLKEDNTI